MKNPDREALELRRIQQDLWLDKLKVVLTVFGAMLVIAGVFYERMTARQDRLEQWEREHRLAQVARMTEIATEIDELFAQTFEPRPADQLRVLTARFNLHTAVLRARSDLIEAGISTENIDESLKLLEEFEELVSQEGEAISKLFDLWTALGEWDARDLGPTPDFVLLFDADLCVEWRQLAAEVRDMLGRQHLSLVGVDFASGTKMDELRQRGFRFRTDLRACIASKAGGDPPPPVGGAVPSTPE